MTTEEKKQKQKEYYENNKEKILLREKQYKKTNRDKILKKKKIQAKKYREENQDRINDYQKEYRKENKDKIKEYRIKNKDKNKDKIKEYRKNKRKTDSLYKLKTDIRSQIGKVLRKEGFKKLSRTEQILGCTFEELKHHLESKFEPWMNWDNKGDWNGIPKELNVAWDIDHIIPLSSAKTEEDIIKLNHYSNLQPLCSFYNRYIKKDILY